MALSSCSNLSQATSGFFSRPPSSQMPGEDAMWVSSESTTFQPLRQAPAPPRQGLQTPLTASTSRNLSQSTTRTRQLPRLTPVKVLKSNTTYALVELKSGERGVVARRDLAGESVLFSTANAPKAVDPGIDPTTGLPFPEVPGSEMTIVDPLVDQAMISDVDSIQLPESEAAFTAMHPEGEMVDGILLRKPAAQPLSPPVPSTDPASPVSTAP